MNASQLTSLLTPRLNKYIIHAPSPRQRAFLLLNNYSEVLFGGAAGGGKSDGLLMAAFQYVDVPDYTALLLRRTYADLILPGAIMDRAHSWLRGTDVIWRDSEKTFHFPSGARVTFGYLQTDSDKYRYQSSHFQFIGFDELTQFVSTAYLYLFSRLRKSESSPVPLRMRAGTNPGGIGHQWVKERFISSRSSDRLFLPSRLEDNPYLDRASYEANLDKLDAITRAQLKYGNWDVSAQGSLFKSAWMNIYPAPLEPFDIMIRYWDTAATEPSSQNPDPDYTVGVLLGSNRNSDTIWVLDVQRFRVTPSQVDERMKQAAAADGLNTAIWIEQEGGASGQAIIDHYKRLLIGYEVRADKKDQNKEARARPVSAAMENGLILIARGEWNDDFKSELALFSEGDHDDQVDALSGAYKAMIERLQSGLPPVSLDW